MTRSEAELIRQRSREVLAAWLESCTRHGKISRNTVAVGIVVLDHLMRECPTQRATVISQGGEVTGARSGLGVTLERYGVPRKYLKEVTTRQGHQDGQRLFEQLASVAEGQTVLTISHRLGPARFADRVIVMDAGQIVEMGHHIDLMARDGHYARMFRAQAVWYGEEQSVPGDAPEGR